MRADTQYYPGTDIPLKELAIPLWGGTADDPFRTGVRAVALSSPVGRGLASIVDILSGMGSNLSYESDNEPPLGLMIEASKGAGPFGQPLMIAEALKQAAWAELTPDRISYRGRSWPLRSPANGATAPDTGRAIETPMLPSPFASDFVLEPMRNAGVVLAEPSASASPSYAPVPRTRPSAPMPGYAPPVPRTRPIVSAPVPVARRVAAPVLPFARPAETSSIPRASGYAVRTPQELASVGSSGLRDRQIATFTKRQNEIAASGGFTLRNGTRVTVGQRVRGPDGSIRTVMPDGTFQRESA